MALPHAAAVVTPLVTVEVETGSAQALVDVTDAVAAVAADTGLASGTLTVFCPHTSCGLCITEEEDGLHEDWATVLEELAPIGRDWAHDDLTRRWQNLVPGERDNGHSHLRALLATVPALTLPVVDAALAIGRWQRLYLAELDGPRARRLHLQAWGAPRP